VREALQVNSGARIGFGLKGDRVLMDVIRKKTASHGCEDLVTFDARGFAHRARRLALKPPMRA